jgi:hypothetical protein
MGNVMMRFGQQNANDLADKSHDDNTQDTTPKGFVICGAQEKNLKKGVVIMTNRIKYVDETAPGASDKRSISFTRGGNFAAPSYFQDTILEMKVHDRVVVSLKIKFVKDLPSPKPQLGIQHGPSDAELKDAYNAFLNTAVSDEWIDVRTSFVLDEATARGGDLLVRLNFQDIVDGQEILFCDWIVSVEGDLSVIAPFGTEWKALNKPTDDNLIGISARADKICVLGVDKKIYCSPWKAIENVNAEGDESQETSRGAFATLEWQYLSNVGVTEPQQLGEEAETNACLDVAVSKAGIWAVDERSHVLMRTGIDSENPFGKSWKSVGEGALRVSLGDDRACFIATSEKQIFCKSGVSIGSDGGAWGELRKGAITHVSMSGRDMWGITPLEKVRRRVGVPEMLPPHQCPEPTFSFAPSAEYGQMNPVASVMHEPIFNHTEDPVERDDIRLYTAAVMGLDRMVYGIPGSVAEKLIRFDPETKTVDFFGELLGKSSDGQAGQYEGIALDSVSGKLYACPANSDSILVVDPHTLSINAIPVPDMAQLRNNMGTVNANNKIFCVPGAGQENMLYVDTTTDTIGNVILKREFEAFHGEDWSKYIESSGWHGGALARNGKIYMCPHESNVALVVDAKTSEVHGTDLVPEKYVSKKAQMGWPCTILDGWKDLLRTDGEYG